MDVRTLVSFLLAAFPSNKLKIKEEGHVITITPVDNPKVKKTYSCPFLGIGADSNLTLDKFLEWKREERAAEYASELRT